jgi:FkbM family methyltransferase
LWHPDACTCQNRFIEKLNSLEDVDDSKVFEIAVPTRRLDDYELDAVGFIKIDVEGHELAVLRGGTETIRRLPSDNTH